MLDKLFTMSLAFTLATFATSTAQAQQRRVFSFEPGETYPGFTSPTFGLTYCRPDDSPLPRPNYGYYKSVVSGNCSASHSGDTDAWLITSLDPFSLISGYFTAALTNGTELLAWGFLPSDTVPGTPMFWGSWVHATYYKRVPISSNGPTLVEFDWTGITTMAFTTSGGHAREPWWGAVGAPYGVDDLTVVTATPEPASLALLASGLLGTAAALRLRRRTR